MPVAGLDLDDFRQGTFNDPGVKAAIDAHEDQLSGTLPLVLTPALTAAVENWSPAGLSTSVSRNIVFFPSATGGWTIGGIDSTGRREGDRLVIVNRSGQVLTLTHQSGASLAANRLWLRGDVTALLSHGAMEFVWLSTGWQCVAVTAVYMTGSLLLQGSLQVQGNVGFNGVAAQVKPAITGSRGGNAALASLLTALAAYGLITDSTTA